MRKLIHFAARMYPRSWRERYGPEFEALLEDVSPKFSDLFNILRGALVMQLARSSVAVTAATFALLGLLAAGVLSFAVPRQYTFASTISVHADKPDDLRASLLMITPIVFNDGALATLAEMDGLYAHELGGRSMAERIHRFKSDIVITPARHGDRNGDVKMSFTYPESQTAAKVTAQLTQLFVEENDALQQHPDDNWLHTSVQMHAAGPPQQASVRSIRIKLVGLGFFLGALLGAAVAFLRRLRGSQFIRPRVLSTAAAFGCLGVLVAALISVTAPREYRSNATVVVQTQPPAQLATILLPITEQVLNDQATASLIEQNALYTEGFSKRSMADRRTRFKCAVTLKPLLTKPEVSPEAFEISFTYPDGQKAQRVTSALVQRFIQADLARREFETGNQPAIARLWVIDPPDQTPLGASQTTKMTFGFAVGALAGIVAAVLRQRGISAVQMTPA